jgi:uncharacterized protein YndB with AHSA1/START domain
VPDLVVTRTFNAPRGLVFQAWMDPASVAQWWGPRGFTNPVCELDVRPGGAMRIHMRAPDGTVYPMAGRYEEIVEPERIVFVGSALDANGRPLFEVRHTVTFAEHGGTTTLTVTAHVLTATPEAAPHLRGAEAGWTQQLERLEASLAAA